MIKKSIDIGYRHFDTAFLYNNELEVGEGIRAKINDGTVKRSEVFISTKVITPGVLRHRQIVEEVAVRRIFLQFLFFPLHDLFCKMWCTHNAPDMVEYACRTSLKNLGLDYIDLFMMHFPVSLKYENDEDLWPKEEDGKTLHVT